jgi:hypothetical protein
MLLWARGADDSSYNVPGGTPAAALTSCAWRSAQRTTGAQWPFGAVEHAARPSSA